ncbi:MAG: hypothetical protein H6937_12185 [Burkholderiales bacterium]|nr:hypothetical protein [Burkholderiales bacterium]
MAFYVFVTFLMLTAITIYFSVDRILGKTTAEDPQHELFSDNQPATTDQTNIQTVSNSEQGIQVSQSHTSQQSETVQQQTTAKLLPTILSPQYDWNNISACLDSKAYGCVCYGKSGERLLIPLETCRLATKHGWTQL